jgi:hypothetical protein
MWVPLIVINLYTLERRVVHDLGYFESLFHFVGWKLGLGCIISRDCNAPLPLGYFDFSQAPRPPIPFPTSASNATYPMVLQSSGLSLMPVSAWNTLGTFGGGTDAINPSEWNSGPSRPGTPDDVVDQANAD